MVDYPLSTWVAAGFAFLAVALGTVSLALLGEWIQDQRRKRRALGQLQELGAQGLETVSRAGQSLFRRLEGAEQGALGELLARIPRLQNVDLMLQQAGLSWSVQTYLMLAVGLALGFGIAALTLSRLLLVGAAAAALGAALPHLVVSRRRKKRMAAFEERLPETIDLLTRAIRAGHPLSAGLKMVADETSEPVAGEFRRAFEEQRFGLPLEDSLMGMSDRVGLVDVRIMTTAILIQRNVGGNLAEILDNLAYTIRERFKIRRQLRVYTAQGRLSGYILAVLPIAVGTAIFFLNPNYIMTLFTDPVGKVALGIAVVLQLIGFLWIRKIINIEI